jgi:hypothetical protein
MAMDMHMAVNKAIKLIYKSSRDIAQRKGKDFIVYRVASITDESAQATSTE